jgi:hypothetical protein
MTQSDMASSGDLARSEVLARRTAAACCHAAAEIRHAAELHALIVSIRRDEAKCCAWCGRIAPSPAAYVETLGRAADERYSQWRLPPSARKRLTHGICPSCSQRVGSAAIKQAAARPDDSATQGQ